jgi:hypothetical protein
MFSPVLEIMYEYGGAVLAGILAGLLYKVYLTSQVHKKMKDYQGDIVKSHARILELEAENDQLLKRVKDVEKTFTKSHLFMN